MSNINYNKPLISELS